jgi:glucose/arabinose dehydrogenase
VVGGLAKPIGLANAGDGSNRLFVIEQAGVIRILQNGLLTPEPFLDIRAQVGSQANEQGLLGLAFHPKYAKNGYFYVNYTDLQGDTVIARFSVSASDPQRADPTSEKRLLAVDQPYPNHNGGQVIFGPDGYLYLGLGDGGSGGDPAGNGQSRATLLGKILRIDVDKGDPYAIPPDNPFAQGGGRAEIWAYGLRNPWRFSFDRLTGDLYIADVGQNQWEEIDWLPAGQSGANLGWDVFEFPPVQKHHRSVMRRRIWARPGLFGDGRRSISRRTTA